MDRLHNQKKFISTVDSFKKNWLYDFSNKLPNMSQDFFEPMHNYHAEKLKPNSTYYYLDAEFVTNKDIKKDEAITYKLNNEGFRSEDFKKNHDGTHILFTGCSETFGVGGSLDTVWSKIVYDNLSKDHNFSGYFNLGHPGMGMYTILKEILIYIDKYSKPDIICMLAPNAERGYVWNGEKFLIDRDYYSNPSEKQYHDQLYQYMFLCSIVEMVCKLFKIKLIWSTWNLEDSYNIEMSKYFNNFISVTNAQDYISWFISGEKTGTEYKDSEIRRDNLHHGTESHYYWAYCFASALRSSLV
jgi:hypothetical protein